MKEHIVQITKREPENLEECNNIDCSDCIYENEECIDRRNVWRGWYGTNVIVGM